MSLPGCMNHPAITQGLTPCATCGSPACADCIVMLQGRPTCAACKAVTLSDVRSGTVDSSLPLADIGMRFLAQLLDGLILGVAMLVAVFGIGLVVALAVGGKPEEAMVGGLIGAYIALFLMIPAGFLYEALMLMRFGQTLGKMACGLRVVSPDGSRIGGGQAFGRAGVRAGLGLLSCIGFLVDYVPAFTTPERTCTHDMAARTRVVDARALAALRRE